VPPTVTIPILGFASEGYREIPAKTCTLSLNLGPQGRTSACLLHAYAYQFILLGSINCSKTTRKASNPRISIVLLVQQTLHTIVSFSTILVSLAVSIGSCLCVVAKLSRSVCNLCKVAQPLHAALDLYIGGWKKVERRAQSARSEHGSSFRYQ
jgi:hypothetical protein